MISEHRSAIHILLVEDNPGDALLVEKHLSTAETEILADTLNITHEETFSDAVKALDEDVFDIILLDLGLPESNGLDTLERMNNHTTQHPLVVLTGLDDGNIAIQAIQQGAQDYIPKSEITGDMLVRTMRYAIERKENQLELKRQNDRLENFASVVSHDLRNPLDIARGYSEAAKETGEEEYFEKVNAALTRMNDLIEDVLTLARQGNTVEDAETIDLEDVINDAWATVDTADCTLSLENDFPPLDADRSRLRQLFENLFRNSVTHAGTDVTITIGWLPEEYGFYVADNGPGIPDDHKPELFDQGFTTDSEGTGFGLNIVQQIAEAHGWKIRINDSESGGAKFDVYNITSAR